jgi:hypothetical protein
LYWGGDKGEYSEERNIWARRRNESFNRDKGPAGNGTLR